MITEDWFLNRGASLKTLEGGVSCPPLPLLIQAYGALFDAENIHLLSKAVQA